MMVGRSDSPQRTVKPLQPLRAQVAARLSGHRRIEHHQTHVEIHRRRTAGSRLPQLAGRAAGKTLWSARAIIMITSDQIDRHWQWRKQFGQQPIFLDGAVVCQIAGRDDGVGQARQRKDLVHASLQHASRVDPAISKSALGTMCGSLIWHSSIAQSVADAGKAAMERLTGEPEPSDRPRAAWQHATTVIPCEK